jgi:hypothetical protein
MKKRWPACMGRQWLNKYMGDTRPRVQKGVDDQHWTTQVPETRQHMHGEDWRHAKCMRGRIYAWCIW